MRTKQTVKGNTNNNNTGKAQQRSCLPEKSPPVTARAAHVPPPENKPFNPQTPKASDHHQNHQPWRETRVVSITCSPNLKSTQAHEDHALTAERPHNRGEQLEHQRLTANKVEGRVSNRRWRKLIDLASKIWHWTKLDHDPRHRHAMDDKFLPEPSPENSSAFTN
jgi:hypothetical protein